jgi:hypothetical protein
VLVRHGSASERWTQADADYLLRRISQAKKDEWVREFGGDLRRLIVQEAGSPPPTVDATLYRLAPEDFQKLVIRLLRELIRIGVKAAKDAWLEARKTGVPYPAPDDSELRTILDRFVQIGMVALEHSVPWLWSEMIEGLLDIYRIGMPADLDTWKPQAGETRFLVDVTQRVMTLSRDTTT